VTTGCSRRAGVRFVGGIRLTAVLLVFPFKSFRRFTLFLERAVQCHFCSPWPLGLSFFCLPVYNSLPQLADSDFDAPRASTPPFPFFLSRVFPGKFPC